MKGLSVFLLTAFASFALANGADNAEVFEAEIVDRESGKVRIVAPEHYREAVFAYAMLVAWPEGRKDQVILVEMTIREGLARGEARFHDDWRGSSVAVQVGWYSVVTGRGHTSMKRLGVWD